MRARMRTQLRQAPRKLPAGKKAPASRAAQKVGDRAAGGLVETQRQRVWCPHPCSRRLQPLTVSGWSPEPSSGHAFLAGVGVPRTQWGRHADSPAYRQGCLCQSRLDPRAGPVCLLDEGHGHPVSPSRFPVGRV